MMFHEELRQLAITAKAKRTAWLEQHGVPISQEFAEFVEAIGELIQACERGEAKEPSPAAAPPITATNLQPASDERSALISKLLSDFNTRAAYIRAKVSTLVPAQIRGLRLKSEATAQPDLARASHMHHSRISMIETFGANPTIGTLSQIAAAFKVGLKVEFVPFSEMPAWENNFSQDQFDVTKIDNDLHFLNPDLGRNLVPQPLPDTSWINERAASDWIVTDGYSNPKPEGEFLTHSSQVRAADGASCVVHEVHPYQLPSCSACGALMRPLLATKGGRTQAIAKIHIAMNEAIERGRHDDVTAARALIAELIVYKCGSCGAETGCVDVPQSTSVDYGKCKSPWADHRIAHRKKDDCIEWEAHCSGLL